ncbi:MULTISPECIES: hypothetical protein [Streptomyces]|uniref:hypothetical protein n=1 Tax=Streptomyces TaxID=1883 RepID=UPI001600C348|nr:hypothetical protein [Streptomyces murinus]MBA9046932.1 hypothetical protein [Streptomyces murinus]
MSSYRDRRESPARRDSELTGQIINATMGYLNGGGNVDEEFARVVLDGCTSGKGKDYPPEGHGYPRTGR